MSTSGIRDDGNADDMLRKSYIGRTVRVNRFWAGDSPGLQYSNGNGLRRTASTMHTESSVGTPSHMLHVN